MQTKYLRHRHGGRVIDISAIGHNTYKGVASWFFVGHVKWQDGTESPRCEIEPSALCCIAADGEPGLIECEAFHSGLNDYLREHGRWHDMKAHRDGRHYSWTPHQPKNEQPVEAHVMPPELA